MALAPRRSSAGFSQLFDFFGTLVPTHHGRIIPAGHQAQLKIAQRRVTAAKHQRFKMQAPQS
jgi:hypothetical protein